MGSMSAMASLDRVLEEHGDELKSELMELVPEPIRDQIAGVELSNEVYHIGAEWVLQGGYRLPGPSADIDMLAERFPDCSVGY